MDLSNVVAGVLKVAEQVAPLIVPGAAPAIAAGKAVIDLIDEVKPLVSGTASEAELNRGRDELEAKVHAHAQRTADRLAGDG